MKTEFVDLSDTRKSLVVEIPSTVVDAEIDKVALSSEGFEYVANMATDPRVQYPQEAMREGIVSMLSVGMRYKGRPVGALRVYTDHESRFSPLKIDLLKAVAAQAAAAIENTRLVEESRAREALEKQVELAADVQQRMIPQKPPSVPGIELSSVAGRGTTVSIRLPLTLAIIDGFLIGVGRATYVVPLELVEECVELDAGQAGADHGHHYLNLRGAVLPFVRLRELFGGAGGAARRENVVVIRHGGRRVGLVVDRLMGEFQTVIKPLGKVFRQLRGIGGFTILGNGEVALILNVPELIGQLARQHEAAV